MAAEHEIGVHVEDGLDLPVAAERVEAALAHVLRAESPGEAEISVAFVGDERITQLNREYLHHEGPTDVIAFPLETTGAAPAVLGDIYVGVDQARRQAEEHSVPLPEELIRLAIHGTLHVLGYDHPEGDHRDDSPMYRRQEALVAEAMTLM